MFIFLNKTRILNFLFLSLQSRELFYHNKEWVKRFKGPSKYKEDIKKAITLHPLKNHTYTYEIQQYLHRLKLQDLKDKIKTLNKEIEAIDGMLKKDDTNPHNQWVKVMDSNLSRNPDKFWVLFNRRYLYSNINVIPKTPMPNAMYKGIRKMLHKVEEVSSESLSIDVFDSLSYGYRWNNPNVGLVYVLVVKSSEEEEVNQKKYIMKHAYSPIEWMEERNNNQSNIRVNFAVPLSGRTDVFYKFMERWETDFLKTNENVSLTLVVMEGKRHRGQHKLISAFANDLRLRYPQCLINVFKKRGSFQRAIALQHAVSKFSVNSLLFFVDIDMKISRHVLHDIRANTIQQKQVYFPIVFSKYDPKYEGLNSSMLKDLENEFSSLKGTWHSAGYGMIGVLKSDFMHVDGFDTKIKGWGKEDVNFVERVLKKKMRGFRAPNLGLVHIFHSKNCSSKLSKSRYRICMTVKWATEGSQQALSQVASNMGLENNTLTQK